MAFGPGAEKAILEKAVKEKVKDKVASKDEAPTMTNNVTIKDIDARISRMVFDIPRLVSSRVNTISGSDKDLIDRWFDDLVDYTQNSADPVPQGFLTSYDLEDLSDACRCENETFTTVVELLIIADYTLRNSESTRLDSGLIATEAAGFFETIARAKNLYTQQFVNLNPLNYGASSPKFDICGE
jgi:hypothetical protein